MVKEYAKVASYIITVAFTAFATYMLHLSLQQIVSVTILAIFIAGSFIYWNFRVAFAFLGITLLFVFNVLDIQHFINYSNIDVLTLIIAMMIVVGFLEEYKFFDWLTARIIVNFLDRPMVVIFLLLLLSFIMSSLVNEVASIIFMLAIAVRVCKYYEMNPIPLSIFLVFTTNLGSSATVIGNPIGVLIAFKAGLSFMDFIRWAFPISLLATFVTIAISRYYLEGELKKAKTVKHPEEVKNEIKRMAKFHKKLIVPTIVFFGVILGLALHHYIEEYLRLETNTMLLGMSLLGASASLFIAHDRAIDIVEKKVDWWSILYFLLLFASVGTLEYTHVSDIITSAVMSVTKGNILYIMLILSAVAGAITSVMDNVLAIAIVIPIIDSLKGVINVFPIWWAILFAGTYWGNATLIGSTANIVMAGYMDKLKKRGELERSVGMWEWIKIGVPVSAITFFLAFLLLYLQLGIMPH
ncbi:MAG: hypothetical protein C0177_06270 [Fervidicoccus fontis]|uniref:Citrate transporter-like domain-containing protein n=1 Tax=Fervidicoccus fontis TaxID=683846 RepID=A0A7C2ZNG3_9CREN|nr:MAG: hypothetical protein C0177_06270 [Fervidicoccus fontis]HEW63836.1 hypothetical protein [Fervidicoccus fontis]